MSLRTPVEIQEPTSLIVGGGCILSIPVLLILGAKKALSAAASKEHAGAHQIEEMDLDPSKAKPGKGMTELQLLQRQSKKVSRLVAQFQKMDGAFGPDEHAAELEALNGLKKRIQASENPNDPEAKKLITELEQNLLRYAPKK